MNCRYCNQPCTKNTVEAIYSYCKPCKVFFHTEKDITVFRPNSPTYWYWLFIDLEDDITRVECLRDPNSLPPEERIDLDPMTMPIILLECKPAMQGVTPTNMYDKLKTLLVFS